MKSRAFTLFELIVSMAIFAIIMGLGLTSLISLKESTKLNQATVDLVVAMKTTLSKVRNNVYQQEDIDLFNLNSDDASCSDISSSPFIPDAIGYYFTTDNVHQIKCLRTPNSYVESFCCKEVQTGFNDKVYLQDPSIVYSASCGVLFEYSTGDILAFNNESEWSSDINTVTINSDNCVVSVLNSKLNLSKQIVFDTNENSISIE